jgi:hypothetical protein
MVKPKEKRKIKKRAPRKKKGDGAPLPKSVQALLKYLSGGGTGFGPAPGTAAAQFQAAAPPLPQVAGVARAPRKKKVTTSANVPSPLQNIVPQAAAQTTIIQVPAAAPQQEKPESQSDIATLQATTKQQASAIQELKSAVMSQGTDILFRTLREQGNVSLGSLPSQAPSYLGRPPSAPSFAGRSSMRGSEGGETSYETGASRASSVSQSQQSIADVMEQEASGLGTFLGGQYIQNVSNPVIPGKRMGAGRPSKSEEDKAATKAAAAQRRKEAKQAQAQQQTHSQSLAQLSSLGSVASSESSNPFSFMGRGRGGGKGKAQQIYSQAQQAGADPSSTIQAMVAGGGAAAVQQIAGGLSLGELAMQKKQKGKKK